MDVTNKDEVKTSSTQSERDEQFGKYCKANGHTNITSVVGLMQIYAAFDKD